MRMPNGSSTRRKNCSKSTRWSGRTSQLKNSGSTWPEQPTWNHLDLSDSLTSGSNSSRASTNPWQKHTQKSSRTPKQTPDWLVEEASNLLPKKEETWIPKNYRPIACLPTTFKILTSVSTDRLYSHLEKKPPWHQNREEERKPAVDARISWWSTMLS